ncbi:MAG: Tat pathway signal protein [Planctomycetes bacterium]|nr:Tat pathway signal protein [Planctomycetota bacterium]
MRTQSAPAAPPSSAVVAELRRRADLVDELQRRTFGYFVTHVEPATGLVKDRSTADSPASIAGTGFALPIWAIGAERGWISRARALELTATLLRFLRDAEQSDAATATGYRGLYYHFLDMRTGARVWQCELSTIDTALLLAGIRFARCHYDRDDDAEREVRELADALTARVQWDWLTLPAGGRYEGALSHGWRPESGAIPIGWVGYNEALVLHVLAAGSGHGDAATAYRRWLAHYEWREAFPGLELLAFPPLFGHQYSHMFVDFRGLPDAYMREKGIDYFENSRRAVRAQQRYAIANPGGFVGYGAEIWGLTACDGPGRSHDDAAHRFAGYTARGATGPELGQNDDGTIAPTAAAASIAFEPELAIAAIAAMRDRYGDTGLFGPHGFADAFNPTADWIAPDTLAIDQGPIVLMIENWRSDFVWRRTMQDPVIRRGLEVLGFDTPKPHRFEADIRAFERADAATAPPSNAVLFVGSSSIVKWADLSADMAPLPVLNRGFGGSVAADVIHFFERVVVPYAPRAIVLYEGDNDIAGGSPAIEVLVRCREIARLIDVHLPGTPLFVLAVKPSVARRALWPTMQQANALLRDFCDRTEHCEFVDITQPMLTDTGEIRDDIFVADMLHMNRRGYEGWARVVRPALLSALR